LSVVNETDEGNRESVVIHNRDMDYADYILGRAMIITNDIRIAFHLPKVKSGVAVTIDKLRGKQQQQPLARTTSSPNAIASSGDSSNTKSAASSGGGVERPVSSAPLLRDGESDASTSTITTLDTITTSVDHQNDVKVVDFGIALPSSSGISSSVNESTNEEKKVAANKDKSRGSAKKRTKSSLMKDKKAFGFWFHTSFIVAHHLQ
jgi:hypothetical protein